MNCLKIITTLVFSRFFKRRYICLIPDTFWEFASQALKSVCQELLAKNKDSMVIALRCNKILPFCISSLLLQNEFKFFNLKEKKKVICKTCRKKGNRSLRNLSRVFSVDFLIFDMTNFCFSKMSTGRLSEFILLGVPVGKICHGEILRECQLQGSSPLENSFQNLLASKVLSCCLVIFNLYFLIRVFNISGLFYFQDYSYNLAGALFLQTHKIPVFRVSYPSLIDVRPELTIISNNSRIESSVKLKESWNRIKHYPLSPKMICAIALQQLHRMTNKSHLVFSPAGWQTVTNLKFHLNLQREKVITLYTSSDDEVQAIRQWAEHYPFYRGFRKELFSSQIKFINFVAEIVEGLQESWKLIIRAHPREGNLINKRATQPYHQYLPLLNKFKFIKLIEPQDNVSSYNLLNVSDIVATAWSSIGLESMICGAPVLRGFFHEVPAPENDIFFNFNNRGNENKVFEKPVEDADILNRIKYAFRWYFWENYSSTFCFNKDDEVFREMFPCNFQFEYFSEDHLFKRPGFEEPTENSLSRETLEIRKALLLFFDFFHRRSFINKINFKKFEIGDSLFSSIEKDILEFNVNSPNVGKQAARLYSLITT